MATNNNNSTSRPVDEIRTDVLIIGSGPIGCTFARKLVLANRKVLMIDAGTQERQTPGEHKKNAFVFQRDINGFVNIIKGSLETFSVPTSNNTVTTLDPASWNSELEFVRNGQNPKQSAYKNLGAAAASYAVGGMATHWTCAVPRQHPTLERSDIFDDTKWGTLYDEAEEILHRSQKEFDEDLDRNFRSPRHELVKKVLKDTFDNEIEEEEYRPQSLPLACKRRWDDNNEIVTWSGSDTVLGPLLDPKYKDSFQILSQHRCKQLIKSEDGKRIECAVVDNLTEWRVVNIYANTFIVCANAICTPQLLFNSDICTEENSPMGKYLTEQPMAFCQVVLKENLVPKPPPGQVDPLPFGINDPDPQCWIPVSEGRPWHCQVHRDAFSYGEVAKNIDGRLIVDLRWFGMVKPVETNQVIFSKEVRDIFGMPQPTFEFTLSDEDKANNHNMILDMTKAAMALGGYLPGSQPQFMEPGLSLHIQGTVRAGKNKADSVVDEYSKVWEYENLYLGGNGIIPRESACNPTLTSMCFALHSANHIIETYQPPFVDPPTSDGAVPVTDIPNKVEPSQSEDGKVILNFSNKPELFISDSWTFGIWEMSFLKIPPQIKISLPESPFVKVIQGSLSYPDRAAVPPASTPHKRSTSTANIMQASSEGAVVAIFKKINDAPTVASVEQLGFKGPCSEVLVWRLMEDLQGTDYNGKMFYTVPGFVILQEGAKLCDLEFRCAGQATDCELPSEKLSHCLEVNLILNATENTYAYAYEGEITKKVALQQGEEHGPFWLFSLTGKPLKHSNEKIRYWHHGIRTGGVAKAIKSDNNPFQESFSVWAAFLLAKDGGAKVPFF